MKKKILVDAWYYYVLNFLVLANVIRYIVESIWGK